MHFRPPAANEGAATGVPLSGVREAGRLREDFGRVDPEDVVSPLAETPEKPVSRGVRAGLSVANLRESNMVESWRGGYNGPRGEVIFQLGAGVSRLHSSQLSVEPEPR